MYSPRVNFKLWTRSRQGSILARSCNKLCYAIAFEEGVNVEIEAVFDKVVVPD